MTQITITINCENPEEARSILDKLENRAAPTPANQDYSNLTDSDGMPFNPEVHTAPDNFNKDGTWRAIRGKGEEAKAARAAWKAAGGNVTPPPVSETPPAPVSETPPAPGVQAAPGVEARTEAPPPLLPQQTEPPTLAEVMSKVKSVIDQELISNEDLIKVYEETSKVSAKECMAVYKVDGEARRRLSAAMEEYEKIPY